MMGSSRKLPFGYKMERGCITCKQEECCAVKFIFTEYQYGASFKELADIMAQKGILYDRSKPWNKNMIARILQDARYTGADGYPVIISQDQFDYVSLKRSKKRTSSRRTEAQKVLRQKCNKTITQTIEYEVLRLLNRLCGEIEIMAPTRPNGKKHGRGESGRRIKEAIEDATSRSGRCRKIDFPTRNSPL